MGWGREGRGGEGCEGLRGGECTVEPLFLQAFFLLLHECHSGSESMCTYFVSRLSPKLDRVSCKKIERERDRERQSRKKNIPLPRPLLVPHSPSSRPRIKHLQPSALFPYDPLHTKPPPLLLNNSHSAHTQHQPPNNPQRPPQFTHNQTTNQNSHTSTNSPNSPISPSSTLLHSSIFT